MITFGQDHVVAEGRPGAERRQLRQGAAGHERDDRSAACSGRRQRRSTFDNLREEIWEWRIEGMPHNEETYFNVHLRHRQRLVKKAGKRVAMKA
jgi:hypothetical protein